MNLPTAPAMATSVITEPKVNIETLVKTNLPPSPGNIMRISRLLCDDNASSRQVTEAIGYEPMLVARILRLANSMIYGLERKVTLIQTAIATIGTRTLNEMVMMDLASSTFAKLIRGSFCARKIWEHSLTVAILSREIAETLKIKGTEEAFTCGLLHDIGKLILLSYDFEGFPLLQGENDEQKMLDCERRHYGHDHAEIGALVARRWGLQEEVCNSIEYHHNPGQSGTAFVVTHIVKVSDIIANNKAYGLRGEDKAKLLTCESVRKLNLTPEKLEIVWSGAEDKIRDAINSYAG